MMAFSTQEHKDSLGRLVNKFDYTNLLPNARFVYKFSQQKSFTFQYNGSAQPPTIEQVQPIQDNTDDLNIIIGNPDLTQSFNHNLSAYYNDFKMLTGRSVWLNVSYSLRNNAIVTSQTIDSGKRITQYVNADGYSQLWFYGSYHFKWKKKDINIGINFNGSRSNSINFVEGLENENRNFRMSLGSNLHKNVADKYQLHYYNSFAFNSNKTSIGDIKSDFWTQTHTLGLDVYHKKKWEVGTDVHIDLREKVDAFDRDNNVYTVSAHIERKFFKNNNGALRAHVFDLFNNRQGFERSFTSNYISERNFEVLKRYFMLTFTWNFTKNPGE